jgi:DNA-binding CsgD family transcriptional regulator
VAHQTLTLKEREIVRLLVLGQTVAEIARLTNRHPSTIYEHLATIRDRLGLQTEAQIGVFAVCSGVVECPPPNP